MEKYFVYICGFWFSLNEKGHQWLFDDNDNDNDEKSLSFEKVINEIERIINDLKSSPERWQNGKLDEKAILNRFADSSFFDLEYEHFADDYDFYIEIGFIKKQIYIRVFKEETIEKTIINTKFVLSDEKVVNL